MENKPFKEIDLNDKFFDSLKSDYKEFTDWYKSKAKQDANAYVSYSEEGNNLEAFLYLKIEDEELTDLNPIQKKKKRLKIGTLKVIPHGTRLGENFIKKIFDFAIANQIEEVYVTVFPKHDYLIRLFKKYGFVKHATKTTGNGEEDVYFKFLNNNNHNIYLDYPKVNIDKKKYLLAIYPEYHTRLLPDSKLYNEKFDIIKDVSHTNSIHKIYICRMDGVENLQKGDLLVIYRTKDDKGPAKYRAVATSICAVEEIKLKSEFNNEQEFINYTKSYSVFKENELKELWKQKGIVVIRFTYNFALNKRIIRDRLINEVGLDGNKYWGFFELSDDEFDIIIKKGEVNESFIIN